MLDGRELWPLQIRGWIGPRSATVRILLVLPGFMLAYFLAGKLGVATGLPPAGTVILWPPNAIVLVVLLSVPVRIWPLLLPATVLAEIAANHGLLPATRAAGFGLVNYAESVLAATLFSRLRPGTARLDSLADFVRFLWTGPVLASGTAALAGALLVKLNLPEIDYLHYWRVFWLGDALGLLIVGTMLLCWFGRPARVGGLTPRATGEAAVLTGGLLAAGTWALMVDTDMNQLYLLFPFLIWAALRFRARGASLAVTTTAAIAIGSAVAGHGPFEGLSQIDRVTSLQALIAVVALSTFMLAFSVEDTLRSTLRMQRTVADLDMARHDLQRANADLAWINRDLDGIVAERTRELSAALSRNEMLLKEVHHRVKNNLQLISSLMALQSRGYHDPVLREKLSNIQGQIAAIAATYDMMHHLDGVDSVDYGSFVPALCRAMENGNGRSVPVTAHVTGSARVEAGTAIALSLAVNELVTNSMKHGRRDGAQAIVVSCRQENDKVVLGVSDNGPGFPPGFDPERASGFGMRMISSVITQAGGQLRLNGGEGSSTVEILVPAVPG